MINEPDLSHVFAYARATREMYLIHLNDIGNRIEDAGIGGFLA